MQGSLGFKTTAGTVALMLAGLLLLIGSVGVGTADAAKKGKIKTCAAKKGEDKGLLRLAKKGKCKKSERKVVFNKKGKQGATGATGKPGVTSAELTTTVDSLRNQLTELTTQVETVVCPQLTLVTTQTDLLGDVATIAITSSTRSRRVRWEWCLRRWAASPAPRQRALSNSRNGPPRQAARSRGESSSPTVPGGR